MGDLLMVKNPRLILDDVAPNGRYLIAKARRLGHR
jgi:hypothetical protein